MYKVIKPFINFAPIILFIGSYYFFDKNLTLALYPLIVGTLIVLAIGFFFEKKIAWIPLLGASIICIFAGLTIYFNDPIFIYIRPTIINVFLGLSLLIGKFFFNQYPIKLILEKVIKLNNEGWKKLNNRFILFLFSMAILNEILWRFYSEELWVNFKAWGGTLITLIFCLTQSRLIKFYKIKKN